MNKSSEVANRLKDLRIKWNKTQTEMAKDCGVSPRMWIKYEQGLSFPGGEIWLALAINGADVNYLLTGWEVSDDPQDVSLKEDELKLIVDYRQSTKKSKEIILTIAEMVDNKPNKKEPASDNDIALFIADLE